MMVVFEVDVLFSVLLVGLLMIAVLLCYKIFYINFKRNFNQVNDDDEHAPLMNNSIDDNNDNQVELMYYPPHSTIYPVDNPAYDIVTTTSTTTARKNKLQMHDIQWSNKLIVFVNGSAVTLINPNPSDLLSTFIRDSLGLKGTKLGCEEGGCGACTVVLTKSNGEIVSVNSCLRPLCANDGLAITTVEGVGSIKSGLSVEQQRLVDKNGTRYISSIWIDMNTHHAYILVHMRVSIMTHIHNIIIIIIIIIIVISKSPLINT